MFLYCLALPIVVLRAGALKLVSHPNVVRLEAVHEDPRSIAIVMTLCRGGDLWDRVGSVYPISLDKQGIKWLERPFG